MPGETPTAPALKHWFGEDRFRRTATSLREVFPAFSAEDFLALGLADIAPLSLMQRLRRMTESLRATLPAEYPEAVAILRELAPRIDHPFVAIVLPDFVGQYGHDHFELSMEALRFFTAFGSAEFAIREFLRRDLERTLAVMREWSLDESEPVRRLASEGCRPRLPWSFRLDALIADPTPVAPILENLRSDRALSVRKSVANHLNDITKDHPDWVLDRLAGWPSEDARSAWIARRALRTLIKAGHPRALAFIGAGEPARARVLAFRITPGRICLGERITLTARLASTATRPQRLVVDYRVHYVKKAGGSSGKVFKLKECVLAPGQTLDLERSQPIRDFTTRRHYPGLHEVELLVNGVSVARASFTLAAKD